MPTEPVTSLAQLESVIAQSNAIEAQISELLRHFDPAVPASHGAVLSWIARNVGSAPAPAIDAGPDATRALSVLCPIRHTHPNFVYAFAPVLERLQPADAVAVLKALGAESRRFVSDKGYAEFLHVEVCVYSYQGKLQKPGKLKIKQHFKAAKAAADFAKRCKKKEQQWGAPEAKAVPSGPRPFLLMARQKEARQLSRGGHVAVPDAISDREATFWVRSLGLIADSLDRPLTKEQARQALGVPTSAASISLLSRCAEQVLGPAVWLAAVRENLGVHPFIHQYLPDTGPHTGPARAEAETYIHLLDPDDYQGKINRAALLKYAPSQAALQSMVEAGDSMGVRFAHLFDDPQRHADAVRSHPEHAGEADAGALLDRGFEELFGQVLVAARFVEPWLNRLSELETPDAGGPLLTLAVEGVPAARAWLEESGELAVRALLPHVMGSSKRAQLAIEILGRHVRRGMDVGALAAFQEPAVQRRVDRAVLSRPAPPQDDDPRGVLVEPAPEYLRGLFYEAIPTLAGAELGPGALAAWITAIRASTPEAAHPALALFERDVGDAAAAQFAFMVFQAWETAGCDPVERACLYALGHHGDDASALALMPFVRAWPSSGGWKRASWALDVFGMIGTDGALMMLTGMDRSLRHRSLKRHSAALIEQVAKRRGLSVTELADRVIPDCGLDGRGQRIFDYGPRQFTVVVRQGKGVVRTPDGSILTGLPAPRQSDDPVLSSAANHEWKLLKRQLRQVLSVQAFRMERAMVSGRIWDLPGFRMNLAHPILRSLMGELLWKSDGRIFRIAEDNTFADLDDDSIGVDGPVSIVHPAEMLPKAREAWSEVFRDYSLLSPFPQLTRDVFRTGPIRVLGEKLSAENARRLVFRGDWEWPSENQGFAKTIVRTLRGVRVTVTHEPGLDVMENAEQTVAGITFTKGGRPVVDAVAYSETVRDLSRAIRG